MTDIILPDAAPTRLPPVMIEFTNDEEQDIRLAASEQVWWRQDTGPVPVGLMLPIRDGADVMIPDEAARRYIIKFMNMKAKRMIAAGFVPQLKTQLESALVDFATPIQRNGKVKGRVQ